MAGMAKIARAAISVAHYNMVAENNVSNGAANCLDNTAAFMTEDSGKWHRQQLIANRQVGVTDSRRHDTDQHFVVGWLADRYVFNRHSATRLTDDGGFDDATFVNSHFDSPYGHVRCHKILFGAICFTIYNIKNFARVSARWFNRPQILRNRGENDGRAVDDR
jgi:hypothetical protein